jgi:fibronectin type 3 domain-containing protein
MTVETRMQRRYLIILVMILAILLVAGIPAFLLLNGGSGNSTKIATTPTVAAALPTQTTGSKSTAVSQALTGEGGDTTVTLRWGAIAGAVSYNVYRDNSTTPLNADPLTATQYQDVGLINGRIYTYTVAAVDASGKESQTLPTIQVTAGAK